MAKEEFLDIETLDNDCARLFHLTNKIVTIENIRLLGGEPLLHPKITDLFCVVRKYFKDAPLDIVTNGILLLKQPIEFWESCKRNNVIIYITPYPIKLDHEAIEKRPEYMV